MTKVLLNSGGMDSFFVAHENRDLDAHVFVDIGQKYLDKELASAFEIANFTGKRLHVIRGAQIGRNEKAEGIIPLRNAELILCAGQFGNEIYLGILENEINSDKSPEFLRAMEAVMDISCRAQYWSEGQTFSLHTPLGTRSKTDLLRSIVHDSVLWDQALKTVSCYSETDHHCGRCPSCFKRWVSMTVASGRPQEHHFLEHPARWRPLHYWQSRGYAAKRIQEIEEAYAIND